MLRVKFKYLDAWIRKRQEKAALYARLLKDVSGVVVPVSASDAPHAYNTYTIRALNGQRDNLQKHLNSRDIGTAIYYPLPLHLQEVYKPLGHKPGDFPVSEKAAGEVLSLPMYPELPDHDIETVAGEIKSFFRK